MLLLIEALRLPHHPHPVSLASLSLSLSPPPPLSSPLSYLSLSLSLSSLSSFSLTQGVHTLFEILPSRAPWAESTRYSKVSCVSALLVDLCYNSTSLFLRSPLKGRSARHPVAMARIF